MELSEQQVLEQALIHYLKQHPNSTDDELLSLIRIARNKAMLANIPAYKPLDIADKKVIATEFKEERRRASRTILRDESTETFTR
ncbi:hypothetical protein [Listeria sp. ILCC797]|uniref:hypothetical protein n=1 Tax=Listeria sp. ILCC797 TaxID=1918333 RepID=UPI000B58BFD6|nr:hypothetical protein [Listeria sp. ILCC797]